MIATRIPAVRAEGATTLVFVGRSRWQPGSGVVRVRKTGAGSRVYRGFGAAAKSFPETAMRYQAPNCAHEMDAEATRRVASRSRQAGVHQRRAVLHNNDEFDRLQRLTQRKKQKGGKSHQ